MRSDGVLSWLILDHLGSTNVTTDEDGTLQSEIRYAPFGETRYTNGVTPSDYRYTGQLSQPELGLYYYITRWYDPELGRFIQADTVVPSAVNAKAFDRYSYVINNPINRNDPNGHCDLSAPPILNPFYDYGSCFQDARDAVEAYELGENRPAILAMKATGMDDLVVSVADNVHQLNKDASDVFSDKPLVERVMPSVRFGGTAVLIAANIISGVQAIRGVAAFTRSGIGGDDYFVEGSKSIRVFNEGDEIYRIYGGTSSQEGKFAFLKNPGNQINAIRTGALQSGNTAEYMTKVTFSGPVEAQVSIAKSLWNQPGGAIQVELPRSPFVHFSPGSLLPNGFMPFVPMGLWNTAIRNWD